jgi:hypothetical protein
MVSIRKRATIQISRQNNRGHGPVRRGYKLGMINRRLWQPGERLATLAKIKTARKDHPGVSAKFSVRHPPLRLHVDANRARVRGI